MAFRIDVTGEKLVITLSGFDLLAFRRRVEVPLRSITGVEMARRSDLEPKIESRIFGIGTNYGWRLPNRHRVGPMLRRGAVGSEFWAVRRGSPDQALALCHLADHRYARLILDVDDPRRFMTEVKRKN